MNWFLSLLMFISIEVLMGCLVCLAYIKYTTPKCIRGHEMFPVWDRDEKSGSSTVWIHGNYCFKCSYFRADGRIHVQEMDLTKKKEALS